ncbi:MAG: MFS transporter, partial [Pseudomonadales bacterium]
MEAIMEDKSLDNVSMATVVALCVAYSLFAAVFNIAPLMVGASIDALGLDAGEAGILLSTELIGAALVAMGLSRFIDQLDIQRWALRATIGLLAANLVSIAVDGYLQLVIVRGIAGACTGVIAAAVFYFAALSHNPVRMFGILSTAGVLAGALLLIGVPAALVAYGHNGIFLILALLCSLAIPLICRMDPPQAEAIRGKLPGSNASVLVLAFGLAVVGIQATQGGYYAFAEQIGQNLGMDIGAIGTALSASYFLALGGAGLASVLGERLGIFTPLLIGMCGHVVGTALVVTAQTPAAYITGVQVQAFSFFLFYPYKLGLAALIDPSGRLSTLASGLVMLGLGVGPMIGGAIVVQWGYISIAWSVGITAALGYLILLYSARSMRVAT